MDHLEVKVGEVDEPLCLSAIEQLGLAEVGKVFVVCENLYRERRAVEVVTPGFQGADDREEFLIIDVVVSFSRRERL